MKGIVILSLRILYIEKRMKIKVVILYILLILSKTKG